MKNIKTPGVPDPIVARPSDSYAGHSSEEVLLTAVFISGMAGRNDLNERDRERLTIAGDILRELCRRLYH